MPNINLSQITDTLDTVTDNFSGDTPQSTLNPVSDAKMLRRSIVRTVIVVVVIGIIAFAIYKLKKK